MQTIHLTIQEALQLACFLNSRVFDQPQLALAGMFHTLIMALNTSGVSNHTIEHTVSEETKSTQARATVLAQLQGQSRSPKDARISLMITHQEGNAFSKITHQNTHA